MEGGAHRVFVGGGLALQLNVDERLADLGD
jgi:hypothetical protein